VATSTRIALTHSQRAELTEISQSRSLPAGYVFRAKLILMLAKGLSFNAIKQRLQTTAPTIIRWKERFLARGTDGLDTFHPGQQPTVLTPALRAKILAATRKKPTDGSTHWSCRKLSAALGVSKDAVHRAWKEAGLKPHRIERYMASNDPAFEAKAADIIGLYLNPPQHAAVFASTRRLPFKLWIVSIPCCRSRPAGPSAMGSNTIVTARSRCMPPWTQKPAKCWVKRLPATPVKSLLDFSVRWSTSAQRGNRSTSFLTTSRHTKRKPSGTSSPHIPTSNSISRQPTRHG